VEWKVVKLTFKNELKAMNFGLGCGLPQPKIEMNAVLLACKGVVFFEFETRGQYNGYLLSVKKHGIGFVERQI